MSGPNKMANNNRPTIRAKFLEMQKVLHAPTRNRQLTLMRMHMPIVVNCRKSVITVQLTTPADKAVIGQYEAYLRVPCKC